MSDEQLRRIEDEHGMKDMGRMAVRVYLGALEETKDPLLALRITAAYFEGLTRGSRPEPGENDA